MWMLLQVLRKAHNKYLASAFYTFNLYNSSYKEYIKKSRFPWRFYENLSRLSTIWSLFWVAVHYSYPASNMPNTNRFSHRCWEHVGTVQNLMGGWGGRGGVGSWANTWGKYGGLKMVLKNTCEGVYLLIKLLALSLQACKYTKNELFHTYFSRILGRFLVIIYCVLESQEHLFFKAPFNVSFYKYS